MLISIRKKARGWVAWLIVGVIAIPFTLFGINSYFEGGNQAVVAKVEDATITAQSFQNAMEQRRRFFRNQFGDQFDADMVDNPAFRAQVAEGLVSNQLIQSYAQDNGLQLSDGALQRRILSSAAFQEEGKFNQDAYRRAVSARGFSVEGYEQQERVVGGIAQIQSSLADSALVSPSELDQLLSLSLQQREADYTVLEAKSVLEGIEVSVDEKQAEHADNKDLYQQAERLKLDYLTLTIDDIAKDITLDDDEIQQAFDASKGKYTNPETRIASHILFSVPRSADDAKREEILTKANEVLNRIDTGEDFAALAEEFSEDPGSKRKGGDLGIIAKGQMVPEFEAAVFEMSEGDISEPIKTQFGYHVIKLTSLVPESQKALSEVKSAVEKAEKTRLANTQFSETAETFRTMVFENPDDLSAAAEALGLTVQTSGWVTRATGLGDFNNAKVRSAAFDVAVMEDDLNSEVIEISSERLLAMHKNTYEAQQLKAFIEVEKSIETKLKSIKATALLETQGLALIDSLKTQAPDESQVFSSLPSTKDKATTPIDRQVAAEVFKQKLADSETFVSGMTLANGDYAVYRLKSITQGDAAKATTAQRDQMLKQLESRDSNSAYTLFRETLRSRADVEIFTSLIEDDIETGGY
ncbi:MAG: SurA N-terminal domain-containing protein [Arenicellales bacterium]